MVPEQNNNIPIVLTEKAIPLPNTTAPIINNQTGNDLYFPVLIDAIPNKRYPTPKTKPEANIAAMTPVSPLTNAPFDSNNSGCFERV